MKLAVVYHSKTGNTKQAAEWIAEGMSRVSGAAAKAFSIDDADAAFIGEAKGVVIGCPSYMASVTPELRSFLMHGAELELAGTLGGAFATEQYTHGGGEMVLQSILTNELVFGMLCYSGGRALGKPVIHMGPVGVNGNVEPHNDLIHYKGVFVLYGHRFAQKTAELFG